MQYKDYYRSIIMLAAPIIIGQLGTMITGVADTVMVGQHSTEELAASSFVNNVFNLFMFFGIGVTFNFAPIVGRDVAQKNDRSVGEWLKNSLFSNTILALLLAVMLGLIYLNVEHMGQPEELLPLIKPYFLIYGLSILPVMLYTTFRQFVESVLQPATSMWIFLIGNLLNIAGNYLLIYGKLGLPELGLFGAGVSTLLSRSIMLCAFVAIFICSKRYREYRRGYTEGKILAGKVSKLFKVGTPIGMQQGFEAATFSIAAVMVGWLGSTELAAHQVVTSVASICYMLSLGLGNAVAIRVSHFHGMKDLQAVRHVTHAGMRLSFVLSALLCVSLYFGSTPISLLFTANEEVSVMVRSVIPVLMVYIFCDGLQIVLSNTMRGLSEVKIIMWISALIYLGIAIPAGYLFAFPVGMDLVGIWMAYPIAFFIACTTFYVRFRKFLRKSTPLSTQTRF